MKAKIGDIVYVASSMMYHETKNVTEKNINYINEHLGKCYFLNKEECFKVSQKLHSAYSHYLAYGY